MDEALQQVASDQGRSILSVPGLISLLDLSRDVQEVLQDVVREAYRIGQCEHVSLSRYIATNKEFEPIAWQSMVAPGKVSLEQKFMGENYFNDTKLVINDLTPYNYRLRPDVARLGFLSMVGIPIMGRKGLWGVIECFSCKLGHFSDDVGEALLLLAKQTALIMERAEQEKVCKWLSIENDFIHEVQRSEQMSDGILLYRLGEALVSLLDPDGIAVFGLELNTETDVLQEVMAKGFSMSDIRLLKKAMNVDFLARLKNISAAEEKPVFLKHLTEGKLLYIVPVAWQQGIGGIIVYYWANPKPEIDISTVEQFVGRVVSYTGITLKRNTIYNNIQRMSFNDSLTELANRRLFDYLLSREFTKAKSKNHPLSVLLIDLDHFKKVNDQHGHQVGDRILQHFAKILKQDFRNIHIPARYGGEEFVVILPNTPVETAAVLADKLRRKVEGLQFMAGNECISLTVSAGIATYNDVRGKAFSDPATLLKAADKALYTAKQQGRNRVVVSKP